jgi:hypothetical protein
MNRSINEFSKESTLQEADFVLSPLRLRKAAMAKQGRAFQEIKLLEPRSALRSKCWINGRMGLPEQFVFSPIIPIFQF